MTFILLLFWLLPFSFIEAAEPPEYNAQIDKDSKSYPVQKFLSSKLQAPYLNFLQWSPECDDGLYHFISPRGRKVSDPGPMILDGAGGLVWSKHFDNKFGGQAYDFKVQRYRGEDYLTFWLGDDTVRGHGAGNYYMLNSSYDIVHEIGAANGMLFADLHEFKITAEGTALIIIFQPLSKDVQPAGRKFKDVWNQAIWDCLFQEIDIATGELIFEWRASEFLAITDSYFELNKWGGDTGTKDNPFDPFHINSVDKDAFGNYLVSARNTHAVYYINAETKEIDWVLGGKSNWFKDLSKGHALNFAWQHDAQFVFVDSFPETYTPPKEDGVAVRLMTLFDNAAVDWDYSFGPQYSRAMLLELSYPVTPAAAGRERAGKSFPEKVQMPLSQQDRKKLDDIDCPTSAYTARLVQEFINPKQFLSSTQGSVQILPQAQGKDARIHVGYGINAVVTEFNSAGLVLCDAHFAAEASWETGDVQSYRAFKLPWVGRPRDSPSLAIRGDTAYASWNGATECIEWLLQTGDHADGDGWKDFNKLAKRGFETAISLVPTGGPTTQRYLRVLAICRDGAVCENGVSKAINRGYLATAMQGRFGTDRHGSLYGLFVFCACAAGVVWIIRNRQHYLKFLARRRDRSSEGILSGRHMD